MLKEEKIEKIQQEIWKLMKKKYDLEMELFELWHDTIVNFQKDYLKRVAFYCRVWDFEILSKIRKKEVVKARRLFVMILRDFKMTYERIGKILWTTHDSILYLNRTWRKMLKTDKNFNDLYNLIKNEQNI